MDKPLLFPKRESKVSKPRFELTGKVTITLIRATASGDYDEHGKWVDAEEEQIEIEANVQPLREHELLSMPEAERSRDWIKVYTVEDVYTVNERDGIVPDMFIWKDQRYKVVKTATYTMGVLDHTRAVAYRLPTTPQDKANLPGEPDGSEIIYEG